MNNSLNLIKSLGAVCLGLACAFLLRDITFPFWYEHIHADIGVIKAGEGLVGDALFTLIDLALAGFIILVLPIALGAFLLEIAWSKFAR